MKLQAFTPGTLLKRDSNADVHTLTQNANEAIISLLWRRCRKHAFCSKTKFEACAAVLRIEWNRGAAGTNNAFKNRC